MSTTNKPLWLSHVQLLIVALFWGGTWPAGSIVAANLPVLSGALWRFMLAGGVMLLWVFLRKRRQRGVKTAKNQLGLSLRQWIMIAVAGFMGVTCYATLFMLGLQQIPAGRAALFITLTPAVITLLAAWWFREPLNFTILSGIIAAVIGAIIVISHGDLTTFFDGGFGLGELYLIGCVLSWAGYSLMGKIIMRYGDSFRITTYSIVAGTLLLLPITWGVEGILPTLPMSAVGVQKVTQTWQVWTALAFLALAGTVLAYAWFFNAVREAGAGTAASYISLVPVFGVLFSWLILDEQLDWTIWLGGGLAVSGVFVIAWAKSRLAR